MRAVKAFILAACLLLTAPALAEYTYSDGEPYNGTLFFSSARFSKPVVFNNLPRFENYPAAAETETAKDIDWKSHPRAWEYRTRLRNGLYAPVNFGGAYSVVMHGCGSGCQSAWVIERQNGRVIGQFSTTAGAVFDNNSRLIIANLPDRRADLSENWGLLDEVVFYVADGSELKIIKHIRIQDMLSGKENGD